MKRRHGVEAAQAALDQERSNLDRVTGELGVASARRGDLAEDPAAFQKNEGSIRDLEAEQKRLGIVIARREAELEQARRQAEHDAYERAEKPYLDRCRDAQAASKEIAPALDNLRELIDRLVAARAARAEALTELRARVPSDVDDWQPPSGLDEIDWPRLGDLGAMLEAGPQQPEADTVRAREQADAHRHNQAAKAFEGDVMLVLAEGSNAWPLGLAQRPADHVAAVLAEAEKRVHQYTEARVKAIGQLEPGHDRAAILGRDQDQLRRAIASLRKRLDRETLLA